MTDEMEKRWVCPKCDQDSTNESGPCDECIETVASELRIPEDIVREYATDTGDDNLDDIEEAYQGHYRSDEEFAQEMAEQIGTADFRNQPWPLSCIDWEHAASELMYDYTEYSGYYFRNL